MVQVCILQEFRGTALACTSWGNAYLRLGFGGAAPFFVVDEFFFGERRFHCCEDFDEVFHFLSGISHPELMECPHLQSIRLLLPQGFQFRLLFLLSDPVDLVRQGDDALFLFTEIPMLQVADRGHKTFVMIAAVVDAGECAEIVPLIFMLHNEHPKHLSFVRIQGGCLVAMRNYLLGCQLTQRVGLIAEWVGELLRRRNACSFRREGVKQCWFSVKSYGFRCDGSVPFPDSSCPLVSLLWPPDS